MSVHKAEAMNVLQSLSNNSVDLVLTDPPYDLNDTTKLAYHTEFLRVSHGVIVFSPPENQWIQPANQYLFWIKPTSTKNTTKRYSRFVEMIFLYGKLKWISGGHWSQYTNVFVDLVDREGIHPHRKPPSLIQRLLANHSEPGDLILDPFAGSGTVEEACKLMGRRSICSDINAHATQEEQEE